VAVVKLIFFSVIVQMRVFLEYFWKEVLLVTDVSATWVEVIFRVKWIVLVSQWCYKSGLLKVTGQFSCDVNGWKTYNVVTTTGSLQMTNYDKQISNRLTYCNMDQNILLNGPVVVDKLYMSLSANNIPVMAKLTNHFQWTRLITHIIKWQSEDDFHSGCRNVNHQQQLFSELHVPVLHCDDHTTCI